MTADCCDSFGGRISISVDGAAMTPSDADITLDPTNIVVDGKANQDGSACYTSKPKLFAAEIKFRNGCGIIWNNLLRKCSINATIVEEDNNRTHIFTGARFTGEPKLNMSTGEIDGVKIEGSQYQMLNS
jgi:hypothetical protein